MGVVDASAMSAHESRAFSARCTRTLPAVVGWLGDLHASEGAPDAHSVPAMSGSLRLPDPLESSLVRTAATAGAASVRVQDIVAGPARRGTVLHAGAEAWYVDLEGDCLGVLSFGAVAVPIGIRTLLDRLPILRAGERCLIGDGIVTCGTLVVRIGRVVDYSVPRLTPDAAEWGLRQLSSTTTDLPASVLAQLADADPGCVSGLLGLGDGLTPLGDDVLAGWLAAMVSAHHVGRASIESEIERLAPTRTTRLSRALLDCAARGEVVPQYADVIGALNRREDIRTARRRLLQVGHTSGLGLFTGLVIALTRIAQTPS